MSDMSDAPRIESAIGKINGSPQYHLLSSIPVRLTVEVGSTNLRLSEILDLAEGSVVELDRQADDLLDIMVNGALIARGEVVTVNGRYGIRVVDVASTDTGVMDLVVAHAADLAQPGDVVLLAPAAASMDMFDNYGARGDAFAQAVARRAAGAKGE